MADDAILYIALVGAGSIAQRATARETYLNPAAVESLASGAASYSFFVAREELESLLVPPREADVVRLSDRVLPSKNASLRAGLAHAWGVEHAHSRARSEPDYRGPMSADSAGRWNFLLVNVFRYILALPRLYQFVVKPELDGVLCVDGLVATLQLAAASWAARPWYCGFLRGCHADESFMIYSRVLLEWITRDWEGVIVPRLRPPAQLMRLWKSQGKNFRTRALPSFHGRYMTAILRFLVLASGGRGQQGRGRARTPPPTSPWIFAGAVSKWGVPRGSERGFVYLHSGLDKAIELQWRYLSSQTHPLQRARAHNATLPTNACNGERSICAVQKLSCKHSFFMHRVKNMTTVRQIWAAQLEEKYDYRATAPARLHDLAATNVTKRVLHPPAKDVYSCRQLRAGLSNEDPVHVSCACELDEVLIAKTYDVTVSGVKPVYV